MRRSNEATCLLTYDTTTTWTLSSFTVPVMWTSLDAWSSFATIFHYVKPIRFRIVIQQDVATHFVSAFYPFNYQNETFVPSTITPAALINMKGSIVYQNDYNNRGPWVY